MPAWRLPLCRGKPKGGLRLSAARDTPPVLATPAYKALEPPNSFTCRTRRKGPLCLRLLEGLDRFLARVEEVAEAVEAHQVEGRPDELSDVAQLEVAAVAAHLL